MRAWWLTIAIALAGCGGDTIIDLLPRTGDGSEAGAVLLLDMPSANVPDDARARLYPGAGATQIEDEGDRPLLALVYAEDIGALRWHERPFAHDASGTSRLRAPDMIARRAAFDAPWGTAADEPPIRSFRAVWPEDPCNCFDESGLCSVDCADRAAVVIAEPEAPRAWPAADCPAGMAVTTTTIAGERIESCAAIRTICGSDTQRADLAGACVVVGSTCAADAEGWPLAPAGPARFVAPGVAGGVGTRLSPWNIDEALERASSGDTLLLAAGTHRASATFGDVSDLVITGGGVGQTRLEVSGMRPRIEAMTARRIGCTTLVLPEPDVGTRLEVAAGAEMELDGVTMSGGLRVRGRLDARDVAGRRGRVEILGGAATVEALEIGELYANNAGTITAREVVVSGQVRLDRGSRLTAHAMALFPPRPDSEVPVRLTGMLVRGSTITLDHVSFSGFGVGLSIDGLATIADVHFEHIRERAILLEEPGVISARRVVIRVARHALRVFGEARAEIAGLALCDIEKLMASITSTPAMTGPRVTIEDLRAEIGAGGFDVGSGAFSLSRAVIRGAAADSLRVGALESVGALTIEVSDLLIAESDGHGVYVRGMTGTELDASFRRVRVDGAAGAGLSVVNGPGVVRVEDLQIRRVRAGSAGDCILPSLCAGVGAVLFTDGRPYTASIERFFVTGAADSGIMLGPNSELVLRDGSVLATPVGVTSTKLTDWRDRVIGVRLDTARVSQEDIEL